MVLAEEDITEKVTDLDWWGQVLAWLGQAGLKLLWVALIIAGAFLIAWLLRFFIHRLVNRIVSGAKSKANVLDTQAIERSPLAQVRVVQRTRTLGTILQNIVNVVIVILAIIWSINVIDPSILGSFALLGAAIGAGLGFGAQNIVKDVLNGIFVVAEDQVGIGDVVDLGLATGIVERVSVRITHVRDVNGTLWYVRNGEITRIGNLSQGWSRVIIDISVPPDVDDDAVEETMLGTALVMQEEPKWRSRIIEKPEIWGLESVSGEALVTRIVVKTRPTAKDDVAVELRRRLKRALADIGVSSQIASVMPTGLEGTQRIRGANPPITKSHPIPEVDPDPTWKKRNNQDSDDAGDIDTEGTTP